MSDSSADRILDAWKDLEEALRATLPVCSVAPPTQPSELLSALRVNGTVGEEEERRVLTLRRTRNRIAHSGVEPGEEEAADFEDEVESLKERLRRRKDETC